MRPCTLADALLITGSSRTKLTPSSLGCGSVLWQTSAIGDHAPISGLETELTTATRYNPPVARVKTAVSSPLMDGSREQTRAGASLRRALRATLSSLRQYPGRDTAWKLTSQLAAFLQNSRARQVARLRAKSGFACDPSIQAPILKVSFGSKPVDRDRLQRGGKRSYTRRLGKDRNTRQSCHFIASRNEASPPKAARPSTRQLGFEPMRDANLIAPSRAPSCHRGKLGRNPPGRPVTVTRLGPRKCAGTITRPDAAASSRTASRVCAASCWSPQEEVETAGSTI